MATHHRNPPKKHSNGRSQRPGQLVKRHSAHAVQRSGKTVQIRDHHDEQDDDIMAVSFLQYCATCEKQIITPSNSILYCSESCRRKDHTRMPSYSSTADQSPPMTPLQTSASFDKLPIHDIIPQRPPTSANHASKRYSYSSISEDETVYSEDENCPSSRRESEAERYLRQFYNIEQQQQAESASRTPRPHFKRSSTYYSTASQAPSLSHSPTSTVAGLSFPYTPVSTTSRPLPPRTNPYSTSFKFSRSIDLVNPFPTMTTMAVPITAPSSLHYNARQGLKSGAGTSISQGFAEGDIYQKTPVPLSTSGPEAGSLKKLFRFSEMQAPPSGQESSRY